MAVKRAPGGSGRTLDTYQLCSERIPCNKHYIMHIIIHNVAGGAVVNRVDDIVKS